MEVTRQDIVAGLRELGLRKGDQVIFHTSLKSFGQVEDGAHGLIDALEQVVGPDGMIAAPTYATTKGPDGEILPLDAGRAKISTGHVPDVLWRRPEALRSRHPLYSVTATGKPAAEFLAGHEHLMFPVAKDQIFYKLVESGGKVLLLGVTQASNSSLHMVEECAQPDYLAEKASVGKITTESFFSMTREQQDAVLAKHRAGPRRDFTLAEPILQQEGVVRMGKIGLSTVRLMAMREFYEVLLDEFGRNQRFLVVA